MILKASCYAGLLVFGLALPAIVVTFADLNFITDRII